MNQEAANQAPEQDAQIVDTSDQDLLVCLKSEGTNIRMRIAANKQFGPEDADHPSVVVAGWLVQNWSAVVQLANASRQNLVRAEQPAH